MKLNAVEFALMNNPVRAWSQRALETPSMIGPPGALRGLRVPEVDCGRGVGIEILLEQMEAAEVVAFDIDPKMVTLAKERAARFGDHMHVFVGDAERIDAPDASFDAVVEFGILHHVPDWRQALAEIARVLKPGGLFYFEDVLKGLTGAPLLRSLLDHPQRTQFAGEEFRRALAGAGLKLDENWRQLGGIGLMGRASKVDRVEATEPMPLGFRLPMAVHTWYGLNGEVQAAGAGQCDIAVEGKALPHPSLVNLFLRRGLSSDERVRLGAWHEAGHLQTLPLPGLFTLALVGVIWRRRQRALPGLLAAMPGAIGLWELASETYVVARTGISDYRRTYRHAYAHLASFWLGGGMAVLLASLLALRGSKRHSRVPDHGWNRGVDDTV